MGILDLFRRAPAAAPMSEAPRADGEEFLGYDLTDPALVEFMRAGMTTASGATVNGDTALRNMAVFRCVDLLSSSIGMLPLELVRKMANGENAQATDHPLYDLLLTEPNNFQTAFEFKAQMQANVLTEGNAYALIIRSRGRVLRLIPLEPRHVTLKQNDDWSITYRYNKPAGGVAEYRQENIFHLRGLSRDGVSGLSRTKMAQEAIGLAMQAEKAAARLFKNGMLAGGVLTHPKSLSDPAIRRLQASLQAKSGADQAHKWLVTEEGMDLKAFPSTAQNSQHVEMRKMQIEEVARAFGVPRPLLMMDDTSWGSGIEQLAILFVRFGLAPWFDAWEQAIARSLLTPEERRGRRLYSYFDERELLRGSMKDQADFYAKALGAGGHRPWMSQNEVRDVTGLGKSIDPDANSLTNPMTEAARSADGGNGNGAA